MTYNVFRGTLNLTQLLTSVLCNLWLTCCLLWWNRTMCTNVNVPGIKHKKGLQTGMEQLEVWIIVRSERLVPSSRRRHQQDKTVLSCLIGIYGVNWIGDKSRLSATENFETVLSSLQMQCELSLVLSWPSFQFATWLPIVTSYLEAGSRVKTSS